MINMLQDNLNIISLSSQAVEHMMESGCCRVAPIAGCDVDLDRDLCLSCPF
jgi:hypothetical protein